MHGNISLSTLFVISMDSIGLRPTLEHIVSFPLPCPWRKVCDCTYTDMYQCSHLTNVWFTSLESTRAFLPPHWRENMHSYTWALISGSLWLTGTTYVLAQCLCFANKTPTISMIFSTPCIISWCLFILTSRHLVSPLAQKWHFFVPNYYCGNVMQSLSRQKPSLPATAQKFALWKFFW